MGIDINLFCFRLFIMCALAAYMSDISAQDNLSYDSAITDTSSYMEMINRTGSLPYQICESDVQRNCILFLRDYETERCRGTKSTTLFDHNNRPHVTRDGEFKLVPFYKHPSLVLEESSQSGIEIHQVFSQLTNRLIPIKVNNNIRLRWKCGVKDKGRKGSKVIIPLSAQFILMSNSLKIRRGILERLDGGAVEFSPVIYRPSGYEIENDGGSYAYNGGRIKKSCSKDSLVIFGKGGTQYTVDRGIDTIVPMEFLSTSTRWECGGRTEHKSLTFPKGTDALRVRNDVDRDVYVYPLTWQSPLNQRVTDISYSSPTFANKRVDYCLNWGANCGKPAADEFCRRKNKLYATAFTIDSNIGARSPTLVMGDNRTCNAPACDGFREIICRE